MRSSQKKMFLWGLFVFLVFFCLLTLNEGFASVVWYVDGGKVSSGNGSTWSEAFKTIPEAIDASAEADEIWVKMGTYLLDSTIEVNKAIGIYGGFAGTETQRDQRDWETNITIVDGQNMVRCFSVTADATLDGLTVTHGNAAYPALHGGGIYNENSSPNITNCTFSGNNAWVGGGIYNGNSSVNITNCTFSENNAYMGGGIYNGDSSVTITGCTFSGNRGAEGGGIRNDDSSVTITDCTFSKNTGDGGGIYNQNSSLNIADCTFSKNSSVGGIFSAGIYTVSSTVIITNCTFLENRAYKQGGAIFNAGGSLTITGCTFSGNRVYTGGGILNYGNITVTNSTFSGNRAEVWGGGITTWGFANITNCTFWGNAAQQGGGISTRGVANITNCTFSGNNAWVGGGIYNENSSPNITNCTFSGNSAQYGGGIANLGSSPTITNCILWGDTPDEICNDESSFPTVNYSNVAGGYPGEENIDADPRFVDPENADLHLQADSPCIDAGTKNAPMLPETDFEGNPRIFGFAPDMGADEFVFWVAIDIKPGDPNSINLDSKGVLPVAVLTTTEFDASTVDPATVVFAGASPKHSAIKDVDSDGDLDMILHFKTQELGLTQESKNATLIGYTYGGMPFQGTDTVNIVPGK